MGEIWRIEMLGGLRACRVVPPVRREAQACAEMAVTRFRTQKTAALLATLAFYPRPHAREVLIDSLWPGSNPETGRNNLRLALSSLRRQLEPPDVVAGTIICADRRLIELNAALVATDVAEFEKALSESDGKNGDAKIACLRRAALLYRGPLLRGCYESWIPLEEQRLETGFFAALEKLVAHAERTGDTDRALIYLEQGLRLDPEQLPLRRAHERISAARTFAPTAMQAVTQAIAPADSLETQETARVDEPISENPALPVFLTRFFGRRDEMAQLQEWLAGGEVRLVTMTGAGGSGKTRLAVEAARAASGLRDKESLQIVFVPLADLSDAALLPTAIAEAVAAARASGATAAAPSSAPSSAPLEQIVAALSPAGSLLVLDNFEQLALPGAAMVQIMLQRLPDLTILVTSRQKLNIAGERELEVPPLAIPPQEAKDGRASLPTSLMQFESVALFVDRAQSARADFQITPGNAAAVAQLVHWLEGVPLALELAAARSGVLSPSQIAQHLLEGDNRLDLADRRRGVSSRQSTLRATIAWSYDLLPPDVQRFFANLAVFRGGFTCESVQQICGEAQALYVLAQLRGASLVLFSDLALTKDSAPRFRLLETLREFAADQLSPAEFEALRQRHAHYFLELAENIAHSSDLHSDAQSRQINFLEAETDNFREALGWLLRREPRAALRLATALMPLWEVRGYYSEGRRWIESALQSTPETSQLFEDSSLRAQALIAAGYLAFLEGNFDAARAHLEGGVVLSREIGDTQTLISALKKLGVLLINVADFEGALGFGRECLALNRSAGDERGIAEALQHLAFILTGRGDFSESSGLILESLPTFRRLQDWRSVTLSLDMMAYAAAGGGDFEQAQRCWQEGLELARRLDDSYLILKMLVCLSNLSRQSGALDAARAQLSESMILARRIESKWMLAYIIEGFAYVCVAEGEARRAAQLLGFSQAWREIIGNPLLPIFLPDYERRVALAREALGQNAFDAAWKAGQALPLAQALELAMQEPAE